MKSLDTTKLARVSVHGIKIKQILTREKQASKQIKATAKELTNTESKIAEQRALIQALEAARLEVKLKKTNMQSAQKLSMQ